jgi:hypothetical protein
MGVYSYHFAASDGTCWIETIEVLNSPIINSGEPALIDGKVIPSSDFSNENFDYTVTYIDPNDDLPTEIWVNITGPSGGNFQMTEVNPSDANCVDGKLYHLNLALFMGVYSYHFAASDGTCWIETEEVFYSPEVLNNVPSLAGGVVNPTSGFGGQYFNFTVIYMDADNEAPISIMVNITGPSGGTFTMMEVYPSDTNFENGKLYYYNTNLLTGSYSYHFSATDGDHWFETYEILDSLTAANNPPWIRITYPPAGVLTVDDHLNITWIDFDPDDDAKISLYYDTDGFGNDGILIFSDISEDDETNGYTWSTQSIPNGTYFLYAMINDDANLLVYNYSAGFVRVEHPADDEVTLDEKEKMVLDLLTDFPFSAIIMAIIVALILSLFLLGLRRRRASTPEENILEEEFEEEIEEPFKEEAPVEAVAEPEQETIGMFLSPAIEARLEKLEKELDTLLAEEELEEEAQEHGIFECPECGAQVIPIPDMTKCPVCGAAIKVDDGIKEAPISKETEEIQYICPKCFTLLKTDMTKCFKCGLAFEIEEGVE